MASVASKMSVESDGLDLNPNSGTYKLCSLGKLSNCSDP